MIKKSVRFIDLVEAGEDNKTCGSGRDWKTTMDYPSYRKPLGSPPCMPKRRCSLDGSDYRATMLNTQQNEQMATNQPDEEAYIDSTQSQLTRHAEFIFQPSGPREEKLDRNLKKKEAGRHSDVVIRLSLIKELL
jgi:hypothetical protein